MSRRSATNREKDMSLSDEIQTAIGAHGLWKGRLLTAIDTGTSKFTVATVAQDTECAFGKFLYANADPAIKNSPQWRTCVDLHSKFHQCAARVLQLALTGNQAAAKKEMDGQSEFLKLSRALTAEMVKWRGSVT
jgi:hypothetical protein